MPKIKWDKKDFIVKLLVDKYGIAEDNVMKKKYKNQLISAMTLDEIKAEINILSNNKHVDYSSDINELRVQLKNYVCKFVRHVSCTGELMAVKLQFSGHLPSRYLCINSM